MKKIFTTAVAIFATTLSFSQQDPQFSQNMFNKLYTNPGYAGTGDAICGSLLYRDQWDKFGGGPTSFVLGVDAPVSFLHGGLGLSFLSDKPGLEKNTNVKLAYSFHLNVGSGKLGIGLDAGLLQRGYDGDFRPNEAGDPLVPVGSVSGGKFDLGAGAFYNSEKFYLGISALHLTAGEIDYGNFKSEVVAHYYFTGGINFDLSPSLKLKPSVFVKSDSKETQADINLNLHIKDKFWLGASYRLDDAIVVMAGFTIFENLKLGYSYDVTTSKVKDYSSGTHELMLGYCYKIKPKPIPMLRNVRFL